MSDAIVGQGHSSPWTERRRHPRLPPGDDILITLPNVVDVEVLDISVGGALISSTAPLRVGHRARLRTLLGREPFSAWFEVKRAEEGTLQGHNQRFHLGVVFTAMQEQARRTLQRFVKVDERES